MEAWPAVSWVLLLTTIIEWVKTAQSRDFTAKDIVLLHPSTTPHPGGFKCFTCQNAADNYDCNRWAPDVYCPQGNVCFSFTCGCGATLPADTKYCSTFHMMDSSGESVSVTKRCAALEDCLFTGCADVTDSGYQVCSSCCEGNICNLLVPRNDSSAVFSSISPLVSLSRSLHSRALFYMIILLLILTAGHV